MSDLRRAFGDEPEERDADFDSSGVDVSRQELRLKRDVDRLKEGCTLLEDSEEAVQCFSLVQEFDDSLDSVIRGRQARDGY